MKSICLIMSLMLLTAGCGKMPSDATDIRMVVYQSGTGFLPMPSRMPLHWPPQQITAKTDVAAIFDAVNHPDGKAFTRFARNNRLALVRKNGQVVMYGIAGGGFLGCDITPHQSSKKLGPALTAALARARVVKLAVTSPVKNVLYHYTGGYKRPKPAAVARSKGLLKELFGLYSPFVLKGNRYCTANEIKDHAKGVPDYLTVKLVKPDTMDAIVIMRETEWPPDVYDASARLERVEFDTITIFQESGDLVRFVFTDSSSKKCLYTDPVDSRRVVKKAQGRTLTVYGPDLFGEVISALTK